MRQRAIPEVRRTGGINSEKVDEEAGNLEFRAPYLI